MENRGLCVECAEKAQIDFCVMCVKEGVCVCNRFKN